MAIRAGVPFRSARGARRNHLGLERFRDGCQRWDRRFDHGRGRLVDVLGRLAGDCSRTKCQNVLPHHERVAFLKEERTGEA